MKELAELNRQNVVTLRATYTPQRRTWIATTMTGVQASIIWDGRYASGDTT